MADNKIVHRISLEGADKISKQLESIGTEGDKAGKRIKQSFEDASSGADKAGNSFGGLGGKTEESRAAAERLREVLHTLHPILDQVGLGIGNLGAFARVAGAGFVAFGAAIIGSAIVGLARLADQAATTKKRLDDLSPGQGASHFAGLQEDAKNLHKDVDDLVPAFKQLLGLRNDLNAGDGHVKYAPGKEPFNLPGGPLGDDKLHAANRALQSMFSAGKADDPSKAAADFAAAIRKGGGNLTPEALQGAADASEGAANKIARSLPEGFGSYQQAVKFLQGGGKIGPEELIPSLAKAAPGAEKDAEAARGLGDSFGELGASAKRLTEEFASAGGDLAQKIEGVARAIDAVTDRYEKFINPKEFEPGGGKFIGPVRPADVKQQHQASDNLEDVLFGGKPSVRRSFLNGIGGFGGAFETEHGDLLGRLVGYIRGAGKGASKSAFELPEGNPLGVISTFGKKAATDPAALAGGKDESLPPLGGFTPPNAGKFLTETDARTQGTGIPAGKVSSEPLPAPETNKEGGGIKILDEGQHSKNPPGIFDRLKQRSDAGDTGQPQQVADLGSTLRQILDSFVSRVDPANDRSKLDLRGEPAPGGGIRGEGADQADKAVADLGSTAESAGSGLATLAGAVSDAIAQIQSGSAQQPAHAAMGGLIRRFDGGGHVSGPGTSTSDSIPAMLSNGEFVLQKKAVDRIGVGNAHRLNAIGLAGGGMIDVSHLIPHFAAGGMPDISAPPLGDFNASAGGMDLSHYGTVDLQTDHGSHRVITHEDTMRHLNTAAVEAKTFSTGTKPGWHR